MQPAKAVQDIVKDELDLLDTSGDELTPEDREKLHAALDSSLAAAEAGRSMDAWEFLKQYRARRAKNSNP